MRNGSGIRDPRFETSQIEIARTGFQRVWLEHDFDFKGWNSQAHRENFPESSSQEILAGTISAGRLGAAGRPLHGYSLQGGCSGRGVQWMGVSII